MALPSDMVANFYDEFIELVATEIVRAARVAILLEVWQTYHCVAQNLIETHVQKIFSN